MRLAVLIVGYATIALLVYTILITNDAASKVGVAMLAPSAVLSVIYAHHNKKSKK